MLQLVSKKSLEYREGGRAHLKLLGWRWVLGAGRAVRQGLNRI